MNNHDITTDGVETVQTGKTPHPPLETWIDYHADNLTPTESQRLQGHLVSCRECIDLVLDLDAFVEPAAAAESRVADFEKAAVWRGLEPHLKVRRWPAIAALAASVMFAVLGLSAWNEQRRTITDLETRVSDLSRPQANAVIQDLTPSSRQRSAQGTDSTAHLAANSGPITLVLNLAEPVSYSAFELEVVDSDGKKTHHLTDLQPSEFDNFFLNLPSGSLQPGTYELLLFGIEDQAKDLLEVYPVRFR